jgi:uncharacterized protein (TIGR02145 family)
MREALLIYIFISFHSLISNGQTLPVTVLSDKSSLAVKTQIEIDAISSPSEGTQVLNSSTGCLQYYTQNHWYQLCGQCLPFTKPFYIDSVVQKLNGIYLYFRKGEEDTLAVSISGYQETRLHTKSPAFIKVPISGDTLELVISVQNTCYRNQRTVRMKKVLQFSGLGPLREVDTESGKYFARALGNTLWLSAETQKSNTEKNIHTLKIYPEAACPAGWLLPSKSDWENLMQLYSENYSECFLVSSENQPTIGLLKSGIYNVSGKKLLYQNQLGSYWVRDDANNKQKTAINITDFGYTFVTTGAKEAALNYRCVRYEK